MRNVVSWKPLVLGASFFCTEPEQLLLQKQIICIQHPVQDL